MLRVKSGSAEAWMAVADARRKRRRSMLGKSMMVFAASQHMSTGCAQGLLFLNLVEKRGISRNRKIYPLGAYISVTCSMVSSVSVPSDPRYTPYF